MEELTDTQENISADISVFDWRELQRTLADLSARLQVAEERIEELQKFKEATRMAQSTWI